MAKHESTPKKRSVTVIKSGKYEIDESLRRKIETFHRRDVELYEGALEKRLRRQRA